MKRKKQFWHLLRLALSLLVATVLVTSEYAISETRSSSKASASKRGALKRIINSQKRTKSIIKAKKKVQKKLLAKATTCENGRIRGRIVIPSYVDSNGTPIPFRQDQVLITAFQSTMGTGFPPSSTGADGSFEEVVKIDPAKGSFSGYIRAYPHEYFHVNVSFEYRYIENLSCGEVRDIGNIILEQRITSITNLANYTELQYNIDDTRSNYTNGNVIAVWGEDLAQSTEIAGYDANASEAPLPFLLGGTRVTYDGVNIPLYYVSPSLLIVVLPQPTSNNIFPKSLLIWHRATSLSSGVPYTARWASPSQHALGIYTQDGSGLGNSLAYDVSTRRLITPQDPLIRDRNDGIPARILMNVAGVGSQAYNGGDRNLRNIFIALVGKTGSRYNIKKVGDQNDNRNRRDGVTYAGPSVDYPSSGRIPYIGLGIEKLGYDKIIFELPDSVDLPATDTPGSYGIQVCVGVYGGTFEECSWTPNRLGFIGGNDGTKDAIKISIEDH